MLFYMLDNIHVAISEERHYTMVSSRDIQRIIIISEHNLGTHLNTLTSIQGFYRVFGSIPVGRLPGTIKGPFKSTRYCLKG